MIKYGNCQELRTLQAKFDYVFTEFLFEFVYYARKFIVVLFQGFKKGLLDFLIVGNFFLVQHQYCGMEYWGDRVDLGAFWLVSAKQNRNW